MLKILGSANRLCDSVSRREMLRIGGLTPFALGLPDLWPLRSLRAKESAAVPTFGQAKRVILLYLYGAAAQHETFDPKPEAPAEIRGTFQPIKTAVPGMQICEHLPKLAALADRVTFVRSMTHPYPVHSAAYTLTGIDKVDIPMELDPYDTRHWPFFGSVLDYLERKKHPEAPPPEVPRNIGLPFLFSSKCAQFDRGGPYGGFLGRAYNPVWTEFDEKAVRSVPRWRGNRDQQVPDPFLGISPEARLTVSPAARLRPEMTLDRLNRRRSLLEQLEQSRRAVDQSGLTGSLDRFQAMAYSLITSRKLREALDVGREPIARRERYGMTLFGQSVLTGRRLLEAGATLVSVFWDEFGTANSAWDTHFNHDKRLKNELLPGLDSALTALLLDLEERRMLDDTLVLCLTEHGRTPKLSGSPRGAGRGHWSGTYCNLFAGGGMARGNVIGRSDKNGAFVKDDPISPKDVLCTVYHLLGIDHRMTIPNRVGRPTHLVAEGRVVRALLG